MPAHQEAGTLRKAQGRVARATKSGRPFDGLSQGCPHHQERAGTPATTKSGRSMLRPYITRSL
jgi:hypothetical protein